MHKLLRKTQVTDGARELASTKLYQESLNAIVEMASTMMNDSSKSTVLDCASEIMELLYLCVDSSSISNEEFFETLGNKVKNLGEIMPVLAK